MLKIIGAMRQMMDFKMLSGNFNRKEVSHVYRLPENEMIKELQNEGKLQCMGRREWKNLDKVAAWMVSAETAKFMKMGGLGVIASELPEAYNQQYRAAGDEIKVVTPMYVGDTGRKKASFCDGFYSGAEGIKVPLEKLAAIEVPFEDATDRLVHYRVGVYGCRLGGVSYIFLENERFFSISPHKGNPSAQDGCYVYNENGIDEVERFAFFSKAVYVLLKDVYENNHSRLAKPNLIIANDWHTGAMAGLLKYLPRAQKLQGLILDKQATELENIPIVHIIHHLGYQGWDYAGARHLLNSLYEYSANLVFKNAKPVKNSNPRTANTLIVHDCYNQASCNLHLADRLVTVSKNYMEEVSKFLVFGYDFRDILKIRKDHRTFSGIVNGYEKSKIIPSKDKIASINAFFGGADFKVYDETSLEQKEHNKVEFIRLLERLISDEAYKKSKLPLLEFYKFDSVSDEIKNPARLPLFCATSRMVEQKGYDIAAEAVINLVKKCKDFSGEETELPVFVMGGAGDDKVFECLKKLKDKAMELDPKAGRRIFVFRGYKDEFAYAVQLASDFYMMPSRFEPCGLTQMEAMAKGSLPVAMSTGGLVDTIEDKKDGFRTEVFFVDKMRVYGSNITAQRLKSNVNAYGETLQNALEMFYCHPEVIKEMKIQAMKKDFSWNQGAVQAYYDLFHYGI